MKSTCRRVIISAIAAFVTHLGTPSGVFAEDGKMTSGLTEGSVFGRAVTGAPDGSFFVAGRIWNGTDFDLALYKHLADGSRDPNFGTNGKVTHDFAGWDDFGRAIAIREDGGILVGGYFQSGAGLDFFVVQLTSSGMIDPAFGDNGIAVADFGGGDDRAQHIAVHEDGNVALTGYSTNPDTLELAEARFDANGIPDSSFGVGGKSKTATGETETDLGCRVVTFEDGSILTSGHLWNGSDIDFVLRRYLLDGNPDTSFGTAGVATVDFFGGDDEARCITVLPDGKILAIGDAWDGDSFEIAIARFHADGTPDTDFGVDSSDDEPTGGGSTGNPKGGTVKRPRKTPKDTWTPYFNLASSTYDLYAGSGYYYYAAAYYYYYYGLANYNYYTSRGRPAEAQLHYYSGLATFYLYSFLESGDPASANIYYYYYLALAYYYYYGELGDYSGASYYYNLFLGYAFGS